MLVAETLSDPSTSSPLGEVISDLVVVGIGGRNTELGEYLFRLAPCVSKADDTSRAVWYFVPLCSPNKHVCFYLFAS